MTWGAWLVISYNVTRCLEGYEVFGVIRAGSTLIIPSRKAVIEMTIGLAVTAGSVQADSAIINTCPGVISSPGGYLVRADLICGGGDAITITSSDVTLEFEEHRITAGERANRAIVVTNPRLSTLHNVHILGPGLITNGGANTFSAGVSLGFAQPFEVSGITVLRRA